MQSLSYVLPNEREGDLIVVTSGWSQTEAGHKVGPQVHDFVLLHYVHDGVGILKSAEQTFNPGAGSTFVIFPDQLVTYQSSEQDPWKYVWVGVKGSLVNSFLSDWGLSPDNPIIQTRKRKIPWLLHKINQVFHRHDRYTDYRSSAYAMLLFSEYGKELIQMPATYTPQNRENYETIERAIRWLSAHYHEPVSIDRLSAYLCYHRSYLYKLFNKHLGMSPSDYLYQIRMKRALSLLHSTFTIEQVARSVGYPDPLYFSRQFKKMYGVSPSQYRETRV